MEFRMIIPLDQLEAIPGSHSKDFNDQHCYYETSDDDTTWPINENTHFPTMQEIFKSIANKSDVPQTKDEYSVFYKYVDSDNAILPLPKNAIGIDINPEPYYNEVTKSYDSYSAFVHFKNIEDAYEYSINNINNKTIILS
jgi:hypothetical protein